MFNSKQSGVASIEITSDFIYTIFCITGLQVYSFLVVHSYYRELKGEATNPTPYTHTHLIKTISERLIYDGLLKKILRIRIAFCALMNNILIKLAVISIRTEQVS